jgi:DNA-binding SARP family transcriptional activator
MSELIEGLWGEEPPRSAFKVVQTYVSSLRKLYGAEAITTELGGGYLLVIDPDGVDANRFDRLIREGRRALDRHDPQQALDTLTEALALWRGEPIHELADQQRGIVEATRLTELQRSAEDQLYEARLQLGESTSLVGDLEAAVSAEPFREGRWVLLMTALYRSGRQTDALRAFQRLRSILSEQLGIEPGSEAIALEASILRHDPELGLRSADLHSPSTKRSGRVEPSPAGQRVGGDFVGRLNELAILAESWSRCEGNDRPIILIGGEPGIGKTQLALRAAQEVESRGGIALYGSCDEGRLIVYQALTEAFKRLDPLSTAMASGRGLRDLVDAFAGDSGRRSLVPDEDEASRYRLFEGVSRWLTAALDERPALLIVDDLHWADRATVLLLQYLVRCAEPYRLMVIVTFRTAEVKAESPMLRALVDWQKADTSVRIDLGGLTVEEIDEVLERRGEASARNDLLLTAYDLLDVTEGNPFFIRQVLQTNAQGAVPGGVRDLVLLQIGQLGSLARLLLQTASAVDGSFDVRVASAASGLEPSDSLVALQQVVDSQLVISVPESVERYRFAHELVRRAVYDRMTPIAAAQTHNRLARAIEAGAGEEPAGDILGELAAHFIAGSSFADAERAVNYGRLAAEAAMAQFGYETAARILERTLAVHERSGGPFTVLAELLVRLGQALTGAGEVVEGKRAFARAADIAETVERPDLIAAAAIGYGGPLSIAWEPEQELIDLLERALAALQPSPTRARLQARLAQCHYYLSDQKADEVSEAAVELARATGDPLVLAECLIHRFWAMYGPFRAEMCWPLATEVITLGENLDDPEVRLRGNHCLLHAALELGNLAAAERAALVLHNDAVSLRQLHYLRLSEINHAMRAIREGRFPDGEQMAEQARAHSLPRSEGEAFIVYAAQLCASWWLQGRLEDLLEMQDKAHAAEPDRAVWQASLCWIHAEMDNAHAAEPYIEMLLERPFESLPADLHWWPTMVGLVLAISQVGHVAGARRAMDTLLPLADHWACIGQAAVLGSVHHYLGLLAGALGDLESANSYLVEAIDRHQKAECLPLAAISQVALAQVLLRRGRHDDQVAIASLIEEAAATASQLSMRRVEAQCQQIVTSRKGMP